SRVRGIVSGYDESRNVEAHEVFGLGAGRGVAVEQRAAHAGADEFVLLRIVLGVGRGKRAVALDDRGPRPAARVGAERLALLGDQRDDAVEPVALHETEM